MKARDMGHLEKFAAAVQLLHAADRSIRDLSDLLPCTPTTATRYLKALEAEGLIDALPATFRTSNRQGRGERRFAWNHRVGVQP